MHATSRRRSGTSCGPRACWRLRRPSPPTGRRCAVIVDAHHHFWDPARADYPWLTDELAAIRRPFGPDDLAPLLGSAGVDATVLVQTRSSLDETREFLATAAAVAVHRRRGRLGRPDGSRRSPSVVAALRGWPGRSIARRHPPPGPRRAGSRPGCCATDVRRGIAAVARRRPRLRPPRPVARAAGRARDRPLDARCRGSSSTTSPSRRSATAQLEPWAGLVASFGELGQRLVQALRARDGGRLGDAGRRTISRRSSTSPSSRSGRDACSSARTGPSACWPRRTPTVAGHGRRVDRRPDATTERAAVFGENARTVYGF